MSMTPWRPGVREALVATLVLALLTGAALDPLDILGGGMIDIFVGGPLPVHVKSDGQGQVSALLLLLTSGGQKVNISTPDTSCQQPKKIARNCVEVQQQQQQQEGYNESGLYVIQPYDCCPEHGTVQVYCDMDTDGGGWTVIQRRDKFTVQENFYRPWLDYVNGFGNLEREFWLGLDNIHALTDQTNYEARFDLGDFEGNTRWAKYDSIYVGGANTSYTLTLGAYTGDAGDAMDHHNGRKFSTLDKDNDNYGNHCATIYKGAWWYGDCHNSNLNGEYLEGETTKLSQGIIWQYWRGDSYSLKKTEIKIRPKKDAGH